MSFYITGIGTALPRFAVDQRLSADLARPMCCHASEHHRVLPTLYRRSMIKRRGSVLLDSEGSGDLQAFYPPAATAADPGPSTHERMQRYEREATPLALAAARAALAQGDWQPGDITDLITVSCTGFAAPGVDIALIKNLGLHPGVSRTFIGFMGCHGAFNGLRVAAAMTAANPDARVLLCAVELCSLHFAYGWNPQQIVANALFADGAAAVVGCHHAQHHDHAWRVTANGTCILPDSEEVMTWHIGDNGFAMTLSPRVPELIQQHLRPWLEPWLAANGLELSQVRSWAVHPGGPRVVSTVAAALDITNDAVADSLAVLAERGNMSSPTILFILDRLRQRGAPRPCVALGFGPGLTVEAVLFR